MGSGQLGTTATRVGWQLGAAGDAPPTIPSMPTSARPWIAHLYNQDWSFRASLGPLTNRPIIHQVLNSGLQPVSIQLPTLNATVQPGNLIVITEQGGDATGNAPAGIALYGGVVEQAPDTISAEGQWLHEVAITPFVAELGDGFLNKNYSTATDVAQMVRDAVAQTNHLRVTPYSCPNTGVTATYNFSYAPCLEVIDHARLIAGASWSWFVDAVGVVWFQPINVSVAGTAGGAVYASGSPSANDSVTETITTTASVTAASIAMGSFAPAGLTPIKQVGSLGAFTSGGSATVTPPFGQYTTAGNLCVAWVAGRISEPTTTTTGWLKYVSNSNGGTEWSAIWYKPNCAAGEMAPTFTPTGGVGSLFAQVGEFSGAKTSSATDQSSSATSSTSPITVTNAARDVAVGDLILTASRWQTSINALATFSTTFNNSAVTVHAGDSGSTQLNLHSSFNYAIVPGAAVPTTGASSTAAATFTAKLGVEYNQRRVLSEISELRNFVLVVGGIASGATGPTTAIYTNPTSQAAYGLRALNPPVGIPGITDQATISAIASTIGSVYDRVIRRVTLNLPAYPQRILLGQPGGATMRYWEPTKNSLVESETGSGTYSANYVVLEVQTDGIQQTVTIGDLPRVMRY